MDSTDEKKEQNEKESVEFTDLDLKQVIPKLIHKSLQGVREEIQNIQIMIRGIQAEIQDIKKETESIGLRFDSVFDGAEIKKTPESHIKEISTGLDLLTQIPHHLRDTFQTILKRDKGASALEISLQTGKSRSLESDYLNQLVERGFVVKKRRGKKVLFYKIGEMDEEEVSKNSDFNGSLAFIAEKKLAVDTANNSHGKKVIHLKSYKE
ncbi:MAG: winged helix-turn-helix domain-containing protein [Candidatus Hodarchaeota archaeon]